MTSEDIIFLALTAGLPILVSVMMFRNAPTDRPFPVTLLFAVIGSSMGFVLVSVALLMLGLHGLGMFDGIIGLALSLPVALATGLIVRARRAPHPSFSSRVS